MAPVDHCSDETLLALTAQGDEGAFLSLYRLHGPPVVRLAWGVSPSRDAVHELVQDTFVTLRQKAGKISLVGPSVLPWLLVTCRNHALNRSRRDANWATNAALTADPADDRHAAVDHLRWVREAIASLPVLDQQVCELCLCSMATRTPRQHRSSTPPRQPSARSFNVPEP